MELQVKEKLGYGLLILFALALSTILLVVGPIPQDIQYHQFVDDRLILGVPNFFDVLSNLPFILVGVMGMVWVKNSPSGYIQELKPAYMLFFLGVAIVGLGSGYYHLWPDNRTLVWDRLPMALGFMGLFAVVIAEYLSVKVGRALLWPLVILGFLSVFYWHWTEQQGVGDLRPYILVQFFPIVAIPVLLLCFKGRFDGQSGYWWLFFWYLMAKVLEHFDKAVFSLTGDNISGHSLKHVAAAVGVYLLIKAYRSRLEVRDD